MVFFFGLNHVGIPDACQLQSSCVRPYVDVGVEHLHQRVTKHRSRVCYVDG